MPTDITTRGRKIFDWIMDRLNDGLTVYASTPLRVIKIAPKHRDLVRLSGIHCEVAQGKSWVSINYTRITAA